LNNGEEDEYNNHLQHSPLPPPPPRPRNTRAQRHPPLSKPPFFLLLQPSPNPNSPLRRNQP
ncbi:unnamed protein product, partial [Brassica napus]